MTTPVAVRGAPLSPDETARCLREIIALSTLPSLWPEPSPEAIAASLAGALLSAFRCDAVTVRVRADGRVITAREPAHPAIPSGGAGVVVATPIGIEGEKGDIEVWFRAAPTASDELLLNVAANQTSVWLDHARLAERDRESTDRLRSILESITDAFFALDTEWRFTYINGEAARLAVRLAGLDARTLLGKVYWDAVPGVRGGAIERELREAMATQRPTRFEVEYAGAWIDVHVFPSPRGIGVFFRDVSEGKRTEARLEAMRRSLATNDKLASLGSLVSGVAHEVRTPLTIIATNAHLLELTLAKAASTPVGAALAADLRPAVAQIHAGVDRANRLVTELRRFTRLETGERVPVDLPRITEDALRLLAATGRGGTAVEATLEPAPLLLGDPARLQQIVINLVTNAWDATAGTTGGVRVRTGNREGCAELVVEDDGRGMPEEVQRRLFEPLFTTKPNGTGLGLSIVKRIAEEHGATIAFATAPGKGTRFVLTFPAAPHPPPPP